MTYEALLKEASYNQVYVYERPMPHSLAGLYCDGVISINKNIATITEKTCVLAEELGHHFTSSGDIIDQKDIQNRKQESRARNWAYEKLIPLTTFVDAHKKGIRNRYELADHLQVTEEFLDAALKRYQEKYGAYVSVGNYTVRLDPLGVIELFE